MFFGTFAGMFGCLLLYPAKNISDEYFVQCAGGKFTDNKPDHFGSGIILENKQAFKTRVGTLIQDSTIPRVPSPGQHLEVVTSENLSIPWVILTPPLNGHTTETLIIACQEDKILQHLSDTCTTFPS